MANLKEWVLKAAAEDEIEAVVIGEAINVDMAQKELVNYDEIPMGKVLEWTQAEKWLDYDFDDYYEPFLCLAVYAWTATKIIAIARDCNRVYCYTIPRSPIDILPIIEGYSPR